MNEIWSFLFMVLFTVLFAALILLVFGMVVWRFRRADSLLKSWAAGNGYRLVRAENRILLRGPFLLVPDSGQFVYRVAVEDQAGYVSSGWVRFGSSSLWRGRLSYDVDVRWDN
jgi:hypothetical protein